MAYVIKYEKDSAQKTKEHNISERIALYRSEFINGNKVLIIRTCKSKDDTHQVLHFTKESAVQLMNIIKHEFNI